MTSSVTIYFNTGFNSLNIPDTASLLYNKTYISADAIFVLQDLGLTKIRINKSWDDIKGADYCCIGTNTYYFVTGITMINENVAELALEIDPITTIGFNNIQIISGWCTRRHVNDDAMFSNVLEEPFSPMEVAEQDFKYIGAKVSQDGSNSITLLGSVISLGLQWYQQSVAKSFTDTTTDLSVTVPKVSDLTTKTNITMPVSTNENDKFKSSVAGVGIYNYQNVQGEIIATIRSLGIDDAIVACYDVPQDYIKYESFEYDNITEGETQITNMESKVMDVSVSELPYKWQSNIKNNKVFAGQFSKYKVISVCGSDESEFNASQIGKYDPTYPSFIIFANVAPEGRPYCRPKYYEGLLCQGQQAFIAVTEGAQWLQTPMLLRGASGSQINVANATYENNMRKYDYWNKSMQLAQKQVGSLATLNIGGAVSAGQSIDTMMKQYDMQLRKTEFDTLVQNQLVTPETKFARSTSIQSFAGNGFYITHSHLSYADTLRFDRFLTMFGYSVSEPLTKDCFFGREYFNFIKCTDLNISCNNEVPGWLRLKAINALESGIRVWHTNVTSSAFNDNPIVN